MSDSFQDTLNSIATSEQLHTIELYNFSTMELDDLEIFKTTWPTIPTKRRQDIVQELVEITEFNIEVDFNPVFLLSLDDEDSQVRASAINGLWEDESPDLIEPLVYLMQTDPEVTVRAAAATALGKYINLRELEDIDPIPVVLVEEALLKTIRKAQEDVEVRRRAIEAISFTSETDITQIIENAYYDDHKKMRISAIFAMGRHNAKKWHPLALKELDNPNPEIRFEATRTCGELQVSEAVSKLIDLIAEDSDQEVREMAIGALGNIGGPEALQTLEICLDSDNEAMAQAAEDAIYELNLFAGTLLDFDEANADDFFGAPPTNGGERLH